MRSLARLPLVIATSLLAACASLPTPEAPRYEATITRTHFGIPHIKATDFRGLGFGAAYARAQDNICLLADTYMSFAGERSKYFGAEGDTLVGIRPAKNIDNDIFQRAVTDKAGLRAAFQEASPDYRALVDGWIAGYNRYLRDHRDSLPAACAGKPWVREITQDDVLVSFNTFSILSSSALFARQIATAAPPAATARQDAGARLAATETFEGMPLGSNGWAFGGEATANGKGLVLANPHFPWIGPARFYEMHLTIPGKLDVAGAAIMTLPFVGIGFNKDVAWTHTSDMAAHMTLFKLTLDPQDPTAYIVDGKREAMTRREIQVQDKDGRTITRTLYASRHGPLISAPGTEFEWTRQAAYAVVDANTNNTRSGDTYLDMARARSVQDVREALGRTLGVPAFNTLAADRNGDALYADITAVPNVPADRFAACGTVRDRLPGHLQDIYVLDGSRAACEWEQSPGTIEPGLLPPSLQAALVRRDYVQNSNDSYRYSNPAEPLQLSPIMGREPGLGRLRTRSGVEEIGRVLKDGRFDIDLAAQTMLGNKFFAAGLALPSLLELCKRKGAPAEACAALAKWDGKAELDSRGAMLFTLFWPKIENRPDVWNVAYDANDPLNTPRGFVVAGKTGDEVLAELAAAAEGMKKLGLSPDAKLGDVQFADRGDERIPISGSSVGGVLNYAKGMPSPKGYSLIHGASYMQAVTFDDQGPVAKAILSYSQSTDPASPHYADQTREFSKKRLHRFPFSAAEIAEDVIGAPMTIRQ